MDHESITGTERGTEGGREGDGDRQTEKTQRWQEKRQAGKSE